MKNDKIISYDNLIMHYADLNEKSKYLKWFWRYKIRKVIRVKNNLVVESLCRFMENHMDIK